MKRTNIVLDEKIVETARRLTGISTQRELVDYALRELVKRHQISKILELEGTIDWDGEPRDVLKTILLTQAINHATEHRAQIMTILTQLGIQPPNLDSWSYFDELEKSNS